MYYVLVVLVAFAALLSITLLMEGAFFKTLNFLPFPGNRVFTFKLPTCKRNVWKSHPIELCTILSFSSGIVVVASWFVFKSWFLVDFMAFSLAITSITSVRLPNLKISTILLSLFFFYDIFWVFLSSFIFKKNVMVTVALQAVSPSLPLPILLIIPRFFSSNSGLLGLGDIILPSFFLSFLLRYDFDSFSIFHNSKKANLKLSQILFSSPPTSSTFTSPASPPLYFLVGLVGYLFGLLFTFVALVISRSAQPALLYLVPFTLIPVSLKALLNSQFLELWNGSIPNKLSTPPSPLSQLVVDDELRKRMDEEEQLNEEIQLEQLSSSFSSQQNNNNHNYNDNNNNGNYNSNKNNHTSFSFNNDS